jgi:hypothetical protein
LFQFLEGSDEAVIGVNDLPPGFDKIIGLGIGHALVLDEVAEHEGDGPGDSSKTVDHDVGAGEAVADEGAGLLEVLADIEGFVVVGWHVESVGDLVLGVRDVHALGCGQDSSDLMLCMGGKVLWRVLRFCAASRLPMNSPPLPPCGSTMQE